VRRLRADAVGLLTHPLSAPIWLELPELGLRRRVSGSYLIFYKVVGDVVNIVRIVHGARDTLTILTEEL
jgi:plasmid stabilization system protein ParE